MDINAFNQSETERKEKLLELVSNIEVSFQSHNKLRKKFERIVRDVVKVIEIKDATVDILRTNGERLGPLCLTHEITRLMRKGDDLFLTMGLRGKKWSIIRLEMIGSSYENYLQDRFH